MTPGVKKKRLLGIHKQALYLTYRWPTVAAVLCGSFQSTILRSSMAIWKLPIWSYTVARRSRADNDKNILPYLIMTYMYAIVLKKQSWLNHLKHIQSITRSKYHFILIHTAILKLQIKEKDLLYCLAPAPAHADSLLWHCASAWDWSLPELCCCMQPQWVKWTGSCKWWSGAIKQTFIWSKVNKCSLTK